jgi:hypothetical protein
MTVFWDVAPCSLIEIEWRFTEVLTASSIRAHQSDEPWWALTEMWVNFYKTTWYNIPEDSHIYEREVFYRYNEILELCNLSVWYDHSEREYSAYHMMCNWSALLCQHCTFYSEMGMCFVDGNIGSWQEKCYRRHWSIKWQFTKLITHFSPSGDSYCHGNKLFPSKYYNGK